MPIENDEQKGSLQNKGNGRVSLNGGEKTAKPEQTPITWISHLGVDSPVQGQTDR